MTQVPLCFGGVVTTTETTYAYKTPPRRPLACSPDARDRQQRRPSPRRRGCDLPPAPIPESRGASVLSQETDLG